MEDIIPGRTQFKCGKDTLIVIRKSSDDKWMASYPSRTASYTPVFVSTDYIQKYRTIDHDDQTRKTI